MNNPYKPYYYNPPSLNQTLRLRRQIEGALETSNSVCSIRSEDFHASYEEHSEGVTKHYDTGIMYPTITKLFKCEITFDVTMHGQESTIDETLKRLDVRVREIGTDLGLRRMGIKSFFIHRLNAGNSAEVIVGFEVRGVGFK